MFFLVFEKINFLFSLLGFNILSFSISFVDGLNFWLEFRYFVFKFCLFMFQFFNCFFEVSLSMFCLELFSHCKSNWTLIKCLISSYCHFNFISYSEQQESSFWFTQCNLPDNLIKTLRKQFLPYWTNSTFSSLSLHKLLIKHFSEPSYINSWSWLMTNILDEVLAWFDPFSWWKDSI